ncbi:hypothetical protein ACIGZI_32295 [Streptomyces griseus]|uniref:hypothetical protein n=1 Tax=Streptomyces griseus TaxID=1911 RepID=UPI0037D4B30D
MSRLPHPAQTIARTVQDLLTTTSAGPIRNTYPNSPATRPLPVAPTPDERATAHNQLADALQEWGDIDPDGRTAWEKAFLQDAEARPEAFAARY